MKLPGYSANGLFIVIKSPFDANNNICDEITRLLSKWIVIKSPFDANNNICDEITRLLSKWIVYSNQITF